MSKSLCVIPARGGSKRIPKKNIRDFCGKPMIAWSIEAALQSKLFSKIVVSSDSKEIIDIANHYGAETPFVRPPELSNDYVGTTDVVRHAVETLDPESNKFSIICCLYATAPFVEVEGLQQAASNLSKPDCRTSFSASSFTFPIQRAVKLAGKGVTPFQPEMMGQRSQDLEPAYHDAGQFYWWTRQALNENAGMFSASSYPVILPRMLTQDIDDQEDWDMAQFLFSYLNKNKC
ncbi:pseudaminic acid cytidylyltransferase [Agarivorans sp. B2Z047]|uniref:pseudaminic acid cytidylyltransferase n=1 Tax=Agarivorans sp. B2Z047 TaxID=2652721 RepID=UPI00128BA250|nr:pseudaminic acid cytidylyltransferase [Agarivorans sp. B2Z047]MPW28658.1 pseudaminic acid cytidylyltransferase [Agarivorans sp. B2Z047]UQN41219.1 pseudaminic acid cytidylyltransferase [Agarivorans sp. B2Z047]